MTELDGGARAFGVNRLREATQSGSRFRSHPDLIREGSTFRGDRAVREGRHPDPTRGEHPMPLDQTIADEPSPRQSLVRPALDDPVSQLDGAQATG